MLIPAQIIQRKRDGHTLTEAEVRFFVLGFTRGEIPDYQMAALAMAICFQGLTAAETVALTRAMLDSGEIIEWGGGSPICDKHSTGGIGDKTSLILAPLVACCGVRVPMISGRGLGPTGGTLDKLESIPGFRTDLTRAEIVAITNRVGCVITGATPALAPADRQLYALRDVTATVSCGPLIVASILSKKLAANVDGLVLDVKWGSGAFLRDQAASLALARTLVDVGRQFGKRVCALQTDMNQPLGRTVGNALEVRECLEILQGGWVEGWKKGRLEERKAGPATGPSQSSTLPTFQSSSSSAALLEVTLALGAEMLVLARAAKNVAAAGEILHNQLARGAALEKFRAMVAAQGGDWRQPLPVARHTRPIPAPHAGAVTAIATDQIGYAVIALGGGRRQAGDRIDPAVGFEDFRPLGAAVRRGEPLTVMHYNDDAAAATAERLILAAYQIDDGPAPAPGPRVTAKVE